MVHETGLGVFQWCLVYLYLHLGGKLAILAIDQVHLRDLCVDTRATNSSITPPQKFVPTFV